jgi:hypothetical protein
MGEDMLNARPCTESSITRLALPAFLMGLKQGSSTRPHLSGTLCFFVVVSLVTYVILDLNQPGGGRITVSQEPFERLLRSMEQ